LDLDTYDYQMNLWEVTPGVFAEYTYTYKDKLTLLVGIREDYSSRYGFFTTPRMNVRFAPFEWWTIRGSLGLGYRSPNAIADNAAYLASQRMYHFDAADLAQERSMNTGISTVFYIPIGKRELQLSGEYYYTNFLDGVIADMDRSLHGITLYNMHDVDGAQYFSHNWQVEANLEILRGWSMTAAFRYTDVQQTTFNAAANAYVLRDNNIQRYSDDGEPSGTAGKPILGQLLSKDITNCLVVVVRWFGGTKLGVPGLIETYRASTAAVLDVAEIEERTMDRLIYIRYPFESMNGVMKAVKAVEPKIVEQRFDNMCAMRLAVRLSSADELLSRLEKVEGIYIEDETEI
jgi:putative IMPACT (imprinted ancient) family translation regulator